MYCVCTICHKQFNFLVEGYLGNPDLKRNECSINKEIIELCDKCYKEEMKKCQRDST